MSVFSDQQERRTVVASDPQRGVGLDQTPLRVLATTARSKRRTSADIRRRGRTVQPPLTIAVTVFAERAKRTQLFSWRLPSNPYRQPRSTQRPASSARSE